MKNRLIGVLIGFLIASVILYFFEGNVYTSLYSFVLFSGIFLGVESYKKKSKSKSTFKEPEVDERTEGNIKRFLLVLFSIAHLVLLIISAVCSALNIINFPVSYLLIYELAVFFIGIIGVGIVRKR